MEWFVQLILTGGLALIAGLWIATLGTWASPVWLAGVALAVFGIVGLSAGIWREIEIGV